MWKFFLKKIVLWVIGIAFDKFLHVVDAASAADVHRETGADKATVVNGFIQEAFPKSVYPNFTGWRANLLRELAVAFIRYREEKAQ